MADGQTEMSDGAAAGPVPRRSLASFTTAGYDKGRPFVVQAAWFAIMNVFFMKWWFPSRLRPVLLRQFGATVGEGVFIRHRVRVLWPWKLEVGRDTWIGEDVWILNLEPVRIGADVCLSQGVRLVTGSHDRRSRNFAYDNGPITVGDGSWVSFEAVVLRGVEIGAEATISARAVVRSDVPAAGLVR